jgi:hypothetical protein
MELNRNQFFLAGLVILLLGIQFRLVGSFTLNEKTTRILSGRSKEQTVSPAAMFTGQAPSIARKVVHPPPWVGPP